MNSVFEGNAPPIDASLGTGGAGLDAGGGGGNGGVTVDPGGDCIIPSCIESMQRTVSENMTSAARIIEGLAQSIGGCGFSVSDLYSR